MLCRGGWRRFAQLTIDQHHHASSLNGVRIPGDGNFGAKVGDIQRAEPERCPLLCNQIPPGTAGNSKSRLSQCMFSIM